MIGVEVDKGWAWLVCLGRFMAMFLETGMVKALGVLLPVLREQFATETWIIGVVISLVPGFGAITGECFYWSLSYPVYQNKEILKKYCKKK